MAKAYLRNCWYQAGWSDELVGDATLVRTILGEPVLFFRKSDGTTAALLDRCPHRFAPLSEGRVKGDSVACGYHGLAFGSDGVCVDNPHGPITSSICVRAFPVAERHTAMWIWMGEPDRADPDTIPDLSFIDEMEVSGRVPMYMPTLANYELITDNILDLSHADFLHPDSLGGMMVGSKASTWVEGDRIIAEWVAEDCVPPGVFVPLVAPAERADIRIKVEWQAPGLMVLSTTARPAGSEVYPEPSRTLHNMVPEDENSTHYFACSCNPGIIGKPAYAAAFREALERAFLTEDKPMLEAQQMRMGAANLWDLKPALLPIDAGAVRVRRMLMTLIEAEQAELASEPGPVPRGT